MLAAARVGPTGFVLATDIAPNLVALATQTARESGLKNLEARVMDAENLTIDDEVFDVVISRFGLFFVPDLPPAARSPWGTLRTSREVNAAPLASPTSD
jgi:ubiquinone/menaquinone biosynthesis C-methylase UbiE